MKGNGLFTVLLFDTFNIYIFEMVTAMNMKKPILIYTVLILLSIQASTFAQGIEELEKRNGFKDIKLASSVDQYDGLEFVEEIDDEKFGKLQIYTRKKEHYTSIGSIPIKDLTVRVYNGEVYQIQVLIPKDPKMYGGLKQAFGPPKFDIVNNDYFWAADSLKLIYRSYDKKVLEMLYHSRVIDRKLEMEKDEEIEDIASDF